MNLIGTWLFPESLSKVNESANSLFKFRKFQTLHFQQRIKRIILIYHAARRCISLMPQAATNEIEWLHSAFVFLRCTFRCIVHCINSSYSKYSLLKKASETSVPYNKHFVVLTCTAPFCSIWEFLVWMYYPSGFQRDSLCTLHLSIALQSYTFFTENVQNELIFWICIIQKAIIGRVHRCTPFAERRLFLQIKQVRN